MELYVDDADAAAIIDTASSYNLDARIVGRCEPAEGRHLTIRSASGEFSY